MKLSEFVEALQELLPEHEEAEVRTEHFDLTAGGPAEFEQVNSVRIESVRTVVGGERNDKYWVVIG